MPKQPLGTAAEPTDPATWVDRHGDYLFRYALARLRQANLAEDLVQEAFLGALQGRDQFAGVSSERTWLVSILKRKIIDHLRRHHQEQPLSDIAPDGWMDALFDKCGHWKKKPAKWASPSGACENAEFWNTFSHCLAKLPSRLAEAFSLRAIDDLPSAEVCKVLAVSPTNLWVMLHRARLQLWHCLDIHWFGGEGGRQ
jgi:RNA polymerase sigma-70 factor (TIGR02943 family)